ncbi:MAG: OsmC family protein [Candidatus Methanofastidiosia archaeon]
MKEVLNGLNVKRLREFIEKVKSGVESGEKKLKVDGTWTSEGGAPHFRVNLKTPNDVGVYTIEFDEPESMGGEGKAPNPNQVCLAGSIACYALTFSKWAALREIEIKGFTIEASTQVNLKKSLGVSDEPVVEEIEWTVFVDTDAGQEELQGLRRIADERCPGVYCLTNALKLSTKVVKRN